MTTNSRTRCAVAALWAILLPALVGCSATSSMMSGPQFSLNGDVVRPLSPGIAAGVNVEIGNPHNFALAVREVRVTVRSVRVSNTDGPRRCAVRDFAVQQIADDVAITIPAHSSRTLSTLRLAEESWPHVIMVDSSVDQEACRAASLVLGYTASAAPVIE